MGSHGTLSGICQRGTLPRGTFSRPRATGRSRVYPPPLESESAMLRTALFAFLLIGSNGGGLLRTGLKPVDASIQMARPSLGLREVLPIRMGLRQEMRVLMLTRMANEVCCRDLSL